MVSRCPMVIRPASRRPLAEVIAETVVPYCEAIPLTVSPERTMWVRAAARELVGAVWAWRSGVVRAGSAPAAPGMVRRWPTEMRPASRRLLAEVIAETVVPYCLARPETVSPVRTTWVRAAVLPDEARLA